MRNNQYHPGLTTTTATAIARHRAIRAVSPSVHASGVGYPPPLPVSPARSRRGLVAIATVAVLGIVVASGAVVASLPNGDEAEATHPATASDVRRVAVVAAHRVGGGEVQLPATLLPYQSTEIFARTSGYLKAWHVDIGDRVEAGQVLAELDTPDLDQELLQAEAQQQQSQAAVAEAVAEHQEAKQQLELAKANIQRAQSQLLLARATHGRNLPLAARQIVSQQQLDESQAALETRAAELTASKADFARLDANLTTREAVIHSREAFARSAAANAQRLRELQGFQRLVAPFAGVITRRQAEVGMLVTAGTSGQTSLFSLVQHDKLRVQVAVPQAQSAQITIGDDATIVVPERDGESFTGTITRTAAAVDERSRTLNVEIELANDDGRLLPGAYAEVKLATNKLEQELRIPASALLLKSSGTFVATVDRDSSIRLVPVQLGRDHGSEVEVAHGLRGDESLVVNPRDDLAEGERVQFSATSAG